MAHYALIAFRRDAERVDLYRSSSHGFTLDEGYLREIHPGDEWLTRVTTDVPFDDVVRTHLDPRRDEAVVRFGSTLQAYRVLRFAVPTASGTIEPSPGEPMGALLAIHDFADPEPDGYVRGWFAATRAAVGESVDRGLLREQDAPPDLCNRLRRFAVDDVEVIELTRE